MEKQYQFKIHGTTYDVKILTRSFDTAQVEVNGAVYDVDLMSRDVVHKTPKMVRSTFMSETVESRPRSESPETVVGGGIVKAPLPGTIMKVNFHKFDSVQTGNVILILEAMKMENEMRAPVSGILQSLPVAEGATVLEGDILFEIK